MGRLLNELRTRAVLNRNLQMPIYMHTTSWTTFSPGVHERAPVGEGRRFRGRRRLDGVVLVVVVGRSRRRRIGVAVEEVVLSAQLWPPHAKGRWSMPDGGPGLECLQSLRRRQLQSRY